MTGLTEDKLQEFANGVADLCDQLGVEDHEEILTAIGNTFIGAALSLGKPNFSVNVDGLATASVESVLEACEEE